MSIKYTAILRIATITILLNPHVNHLHPSLYDQSITYMPKTIYSKNTKKIDNVKVFRYDTILADGIERI